MTVAEKLIKNIKVLADIKVMSESDIKLVMLSIQEMVTLSPIELLSLLDNLDIVIEQGKLEMSNEESEEIKKELVEDGS